MGTTLTNGVYLPNEGERNCYAGLKTNWEILDQKVADVTALQQAVAGALHREIVESLPTTDIDPNTIYMILSGTSATENVYNEFMYVNNAWELIGTSATDLTNYYTKSEVDGKLLLKANASDLTSHTGDTTIHVTTADKNRWNNQSYVFRYSSTTLVASSTNSNALLDNTDNLKVGDKVIDSSGVLFSITAIDTANSTFTIGTALIDLANDSDVVHKSGAETVGGVKTFSDNTLIYNSDATANTPVLILKNSKVSKGSSSETGAQMVRFYDKGDALVGELENVVGNKQTALRYRVSTLDSNNQPLSIYVTLIVSSTGSKLLCPGEDNGISLGGFTLRWSRVYATEYYYGSNNIEFSTKFVTTDTNQTISGTKTFSDSLIIYNNDSSQNTKNLTISSSKIQVGDTSNSDAFGIVFNAGSSYVSRIMAYKDTSGTQNLQFSVRTKDSSNNLIGAMIRLRLFANGFSTFESDGDNLVSLGSSSNKWKNIQTYQVNGLEPSSLSLPSDNINDIIDISSYLSVLDGSNANTYVAPANGWISITMSSCSGIQAYITGLWGHQIVRPTVGSVRFFMPVLKNKTINILIFGGTIDNARFIPCQGNV